MGVVSAAVDFAEAYVARGWAVFPLRPRSKAPATPHGFKDASRDPGQVQRWFGAGSTYNIGIATGATSKFFAVDVDPRHAGDETLGALERVHGTLPQTVRSVTGGGGQHILYRQPEGVKLASALGDGVEIKTDGGYIVAPPSVHPDTEKTYAWDLGALPSETPIAEAPGWMLEALTRRDRPPLHPVDGADAADTVIGHAFELAGMLGRPLPGGKRAVRCPWSHEHSDDRGRGIDSSTCILPPTTPARWGAFRCQHAHCASRRFDDVMGALPPGHVRAAREKYRQVPPPKSWGEGEPFDAARLPGFPVESFPSWLACWVRDVATFAQVPVDLPACVALGVLSYAVCRFVDVQVRDGWTEPTNLYTVTALPPGERKSNVFTMATDPVQAYQRELAERLAPEIGRRKVEREILQSRIDAAKRDAGKGKPDARARAKEQALDLTEQLRALPELNVPTLIADDCTPEALAILLGQSSERIGIFSPEGGPFEIMAGRYSERSNLEIYLKGHPGDRHAVARVKREPIALERPLVAMALTVQPMVIAGLAQRDGFRGKGLLARFLYSLPTSRVGEREIDTATIPEDTKEAYRESLTWLLRADAKVILGFSQEADRARVDFARALEPRLGADGDLCAIADWANKLTGAVCRIAGILHMAAHARCTQPIPLVISGETFRHAVKIGLYFLDHALAAFDSMGSDETTELAKRVWAWVKRSRRAEFSAEDARRATHSKSKDIEPAIAQLCDRNLVRKLPDPPPTGGRPASPRFEVRP